MGQRTENRLAQIGRSTVGSMFQRRKVNRIRKKIVCLTVSLLAGISGLALAQNSYPSSGDIILDGYSVSLYAPATSGGWSRGLTYFTSGGGTRTGNIGMHGTGAEVRSIYMAHGQSPWNSGLGIYVKPDGKVGVGTDSPAATLSVDGTTQTKEVIVTEQASAWPDYVFEAGYQLPDPAEVEKFVRKYRHLPGLPAAEEIERDGQNLGAIQARLLEKIEELTLHMIAQTKQLQQQHEEIQKLKYLLNSGANRKKVR